MTSSGIRKPRLIFAAGAVLALSIAPAAIAGGAEDERERARAGVKSASVKGKIKKLTKELNALKDQVDASEGAPAPPTGQAGGDLRGSYPSPSLGPNTVGSGEVIANALKGDDVDEDSLASSVLQRRVSDSCPPGESIRAIDANGTNVNCETVGGGGNPTGAAGGDLAGSSYPNPEIAVDAIGSPEIATGSVDQSEIVAGGVASSEVFDDSLTASDLAPDSVGSSEVATNAVGSPEVFPDSLTSADLAPNSVDSTEIANSAVDTADVQNETLQATDLAAGSVGSSEVANGSLTGSDLNKPTLWQAEYGDFGNCDPEGGADLSCGAVTMTLPAGGGSVLLQASGGFVGTQVSAADEGTCEIREGATNLSGTMNFGQGAGGEHHTDGRADGFALSAFDVGNVVGDHTWALVCDETAGKMHLRDSKLSAIFFP